MATGTSTDHSGRLTSGFTLLEVLIALLIIGITLALLRLTVNPRQQGVSEEGQRLAALLNLAREEAILNSAEMALELTPAGYRFVRLDGDTWQPLSDDETLRDRALPAGVSMHLTIEGEAIPLPPSAEVEGPSDRDQGPARVYLLSSGEVTPFTLTLEDRSAGSVCSLTITADELVEVTTR